MKYDFVMMGGKSCLHVVIDILVTMHMQIIYMFMLFGYISIASSA